MVKRFIAAALLVAIMAWAKMAMAPMFVMHVWHAHPGREMAEQKATHHHAMPAGHPCCPGIGKTENADLLEFAAGSQPCQDEHRCCFRQGPLSVPAPVSAGRRLSSDIAPAEIAELSPARAESFVSLATAVAPGLPPSLFGMVLRSE